MNLCRCRLLGYRIPASLQIFSTMQVLHPCSLLISSEWIVPSARCPCFLSSKSNAPNSQHLYRTLMGGVERASEMEIAQSFGHDCHVEHLRLNFLNEDEVTGLLKRCREIQAENRLSASKMLKFCSEIGSFIQFQARLIAVSLCTSCPGGHSSQRL